MKCKPNQLVRYVGKETYGESSIYGWIGTTVRQRICPVYKVIGWEVDPPLFKGYRTWRPGIMVDGRYVNERSLQPIENPGEDAVDQMVLRVGKPKTENKLLTV